MALLGVKVGNWLYFAAIAFLLLCAVLGIIAARKKSQAFSKKLILIILWVNFAFHFLKQLNPYYMAKWPTELSRSAPENLCAVLILASPFIFLFGNSYLKDYLFYVGILSAIAAYVYPTAPIKMGLDNTEGILETLRYYICHMPLLVVPLIMVESGLYKPDYHRIWAIPFIFVGVQFIIGLNAVICFAAGVSYNVPNHSWAEFFTNKYDNNQSSTFGPPLVVEEKMGWAIKLFIPGIQYFHVNGVKYYTPAIWIFIPICIMTLILGPLVALKWEYAHMKSDFQALVKRVKEKKENAS